jgi:hypothetical protein
LWFAVFSLVVSRPTDVAESHPGKINNLTSSGSSFSFDEQSLIQLSEILDSTDQDQEAESAYLPLVLKTRGSTACSVSDFGTMLIETPPGDWISPAEVIIYANDQLGIKGQVATGSPSDKVRDEWYSKLPGWRRAFIRGTYEQLLNIHAAATVFGMQDMYECIAYGPESPHQAGEEALEPLVWVPKAEEVAEEAGKCLVYGPAVKDYERMATPEGEDKPREDLLADLISQVAPHVDVWVVQLAKYQLWADGGHDEDGNDFTMDDFIAWIGWWNTQIKTANPNAEVWTQLGIGVFDPILKACLPPQPPEYILEYREALIKAGVDGIFVMPSQSCQNSENPQDHEYYLQSLDVFKQAMTIACEPW